MAINVDHYMFMSNTVICVVYVDDCMFLVCSQSEIAPTDYRHQVDFLHLLYFAAVITYFIRIPTLLRLWQ